MRCANPNCNHVLTDFETTRKDRGGLYLDLCVFCLPYDPERDIINPKFAHVAREGYNENEGDEVYDDTYEDD